MAAVHNLAGIFTLSIHLQETQEEPQFVSVPQKEGVQVSITQTVSRHVHFSTSGGEDGAGGLFTSH